MMSNQTICRKCGAPLGVGARQGFCPKCVFTLIAGVVAVALVGLAIVLWQRQARLRALALAEKELIAEAVSSSPRSTSTIWIGEQESGGVIGTPDDMPDKFKPFRVTSSDISPDGALKAWGRADGLVQIRQNHGQMLVTSRLPHASSISAIRFSDDGLLVATGAGADIRIWAAQSGRFIAGPLKADNGVVIGLRFTEDGKHLVGLSSSNILAVWDTRSWQLRGSRMVPISPQQSQSR